MSVLQLKLELRHLVILTRQRRKIYLPMHGKESRRIGRIGTSVVSLSRRTTGIVVKKSFCGVVEALRMPLSMR